MRVSLVAIVFAALIGIMAGCDHPRPASSGPIQGRLDAALAITDLDQRNSALAKVAADAGAAGDVEVVKKALEKITNLDVRSETAGAAALKLAEAGKTAEATEIAKKIPNLDKRNSVLSKLAKGG